MKFMSSSFVSDQTSPPTFHAQQVSHKCRRRASALPAIAAAMLLAAGPSLAREWPLDTASYLGGTGTNDSVRASAIQSDGTVVLAANISDATPGGLAPMLLGGSTATTPGAIVRLSRDGRTVLSVTRLAKELWDMAIDGSDNIYVAARAAGIIKLNPQAGAILWQRDNGGSCDRVDAAPNGYAVGLRGSWDSSGWTANGAGTIFVYDNHGNQLASFPGHNRTQDVAIDDVTQSVFAVGWANKNSCNNPVQVAYIKSHTYSGAQKWKSYDWTGNQLDPGCSAPCGVNNMADTRGYRIAMGRDGYLYMAAECAGGNHIFRYDPYDLCKSVPIVGGDKYHSFANTAAEHKTFFGRYDPATGNHVLGQQWTARNSTEKGNTVRMRSGSITADETGRVFISGNTACSLPYSTDHTGCDQTCSGAYVLGMSADLRTRLLSTRINASGEMTTVAARVLPGQTNPNVVFGGRTTSTTFTLEAIQPEPATFSDGMFAVIDATNPQPVIVIVDNADSAGVTLTGSWSTSNSGSGYYGANYRHDGNSGKGSKSVRFTPELPEANHYEVFVRHAAAADRATNARFVLTHAGGSDVFVVNQQQCGGRWISLGSFFFEAGTAGHVLVDNTGTDGIVVADAVRFVGAMDSALPPAAPTGLTAAAVSRHDIALAWTDNADNEDGFKIERSFDGSAFTEIATVGPNLTGHTDSGLDADTAAWYRVRAFNDAGHSDYSNVAGATTFPPNAPPTVSLASPAEGATFTAPADILIRADAEDADGSVVSVSFHNGASLLATVTAAPWEFLWTGVAAGAYQLTATATDNEAASSTSAPVNIEVVEPPPPPPPPGFEARVNFQPANAPVPDGYLMDSGAVFGERGNGFSYGWNATNNNTRRRNSSSSPDPRYDTLNHMQKGGTYTWEIAVPNGDYHVFVVAGDANFTDSVYRINVEGVLAVDGTPTSSQRWLEGSVTVTVTDGRLTVSNASGAKNNKICFIDILSVTTTPPNEPPTVAITSPADGATFTEGQSVTITADAADPDGEVSRVEFFVDATKVGQATAAPYAVDWTATLGARALTAVATDNAGASTTSAPVNIAVVEPPALVVKINFQTATAPVPDGYLADTGAVFGDRGNGFSYGWNAATNETRERNKHPDKRYDTLNHLQKSSNPHAIWEIALPNGTYTVHLVAGDPGFTDQINNFDIEGVVVTDPDGQDNFDEYSVTVTVSDGRLSIGPAAGASNAKICFVDIEQVAPTSLTVAGDDPASEEPVAATQPATLRPGTKTIATGADGGDASSWTLAGSDRVLFAVNAGGEDYTDAAGLLHVSDMWFEGGEELHATVEITGTDEVALYQTMRAGDFSYSLPAADGEYVVTLKFVVPGDGEHATCGFHVWIEGEPVCDRLEPSAEPSPGMAFDVRLATTVGDGALDIVFTPGEVPAHVCGIVVEKP
jgi:hypothetical protein